MMRLLNVKDLVDGWRLPTLDELNKLYNNKDKIGGFKTTVFDAVWYWSSTELGDRAHIQNFYNGAKHHNVKALRKQCSRR